MKKRLFLFVAIALPVLASCAQDPHKVKWMLAFEDNFDAPTVNAVEWNMYDGPGHNRHGLRRPEAFTQEDGNLVITACMKDSLVVSGGMAHRTGYLPPVKFEFRARCENDATDCTSGVVLTWPDDNKWPSHGELDIFETLNDRERSPMHTFLHYGADNSQLEFEYDIDGTQWQEMALEWFEDAIYIYLNGELVAQTTDPAVIPQWPHHICLQLDAFRHKMADPVHMYVDYVRIYTASKNRKKNK